MRTHVIRKVCEKGVASKGLVSYRTEEVGRVSKREALEGAGAGGCFNHFCLSFFTLTLLSLNPRSLQDG